VNVAPAELWGAANAETSLGAADTSVCATFHSCQMLETPVLARMEFERYFTVYLS